MTLYPNGARTAPKVSSPFGRRRGGAFSFHYGADLIGFSAARAAAAGTVTFAGWANDAAGNTVIVWHGDGVETLYMHLDTITTRKGAQVAEGVQLGVVGSTGNATGKCLHFEVRQHGKSVDPLAWIAARLGTAPKFPLPVGSYFGPRTGPKRSVSGYYSHRANLRVWQQRMQDRGWPIKPDGLYGDATGDVAEAFQREKGLPVNRMIDRATWKAAWATPVT